jgi:hypothetical protein
MMRSRPPKKETKQQLEDTKQILLTLTRSNEPIDLTTIVLGFEDHFNAGSELAKSSEE